MKHLIVVVAAIAVGALGGCKKPATAAGADVLSHHGRYAGIGIYEAGPQWSKIVVAGQPATAVGAGAAKTSDDDEIIVVVDSNTGEIRQCGNLSGYCVGMSPWAKGLVAAQAVPVSLTDHTRTIGALTPASPSDAAASDAAAAASSAASR